MPAAAEVRFPADAGVIDVTTRGVTPNDGVDDTAAIQSIFDTFVVPRFGGGDRIVYFPDGVYDVSETLQIPDPARYINVQGQSQAGTVLRLQNDLAGFDGAILNFGGGSADRFENSIRDLTLDVGMGNPGAIGLQFNASNQGIAKNLTVRSSDPAKAGRIGFDVGYDDTIGPLLVKNLTVDGFDTGIRSQFEANSKVFEDITLQDQNVLGWQNSNTATVMVRNLNSQNTVPVIDVGPAPNNSPDPGNGRIVVVGGSLAGGPGADSNPAIRVGNFVPAVYLKDVQTQGYGQAVSRETQAFQGNTGLPDGRVDEYWYAGSSGVSRRGGVYQAFDNTPDTSLGLAVRETPDAAITPVNQWGNPADFGAIPNDGIDDTAAIQAAIDSGAQTVYLPNGEWTLNGTLELRGNLERLVGTEARWQTNGAGKIRLGDNGPETVFVERISGELGDLPRVTYEHDSERTWVFKSVSQWEYDPAAQNPGDLFLEDVQGGSPTDGLTFRNQNVWARQFNNEVPADTTDPLLPDAKITVDNARVWVLGLKTENAGTIVRTINGGFAELLGVYRNGPGQSDTDNPAFLAVDAALAVSAFSIRPNNDGYDLFAREIRDGVTVDSPTFDDANVYAAFTNEQLWEVRKTIHLDNADAEGVAFNGSWQSSTGFPGGFVGEDFVFSSVTGDTAAFRPDLPEKGLYEVAVRWVNDVGGQDHSGHATQVLIEVHGLDGVEQILVDQNDLGGMWVTLGRFNFAPGEAGSIRYIVTDAAGGKIIVDGVRLILVPEPSSIALSMLSFVGTALAIGRRRMDNRKLTWNP